MFKDNFKILKNRNLLSVLISFVIFTIILLLSKIDVLYIVNKNVQSLYFGLNKSISTNILVVEIDEDTLSGRKLPDGTITKKGLGRFPFDRKYFAKVIDNLSKAGATVIGIDVIFGEESTLESDELLANSIKNAGNVVLGVWNDSAGNVQLPYNQFSENTIAKGFYSVNTDKIVNLVYSIIPFRKYLNSDKIYEHFTIAILRAFYSKIYDDSTYLTKEFELSNDKIFIGNRVQLIRAKENENSVLINYSQIDKFYKKSFLDIYNGDFKQVDVKDKIVIIGATADGIKDVFETPIGSLYGVYLHANMINTVITNNGIRYINHNLEWLLIFLLIVISVYFNISRSSYVLIFSNISLIAIFGLLVTYVTYKTNFIFSYLVEFVVALIFSLLITNILKYYIENKHKAKLNKALSEYVSEDVAREILSGEGRINLDGENKEIAIFFSDIEGFTSISEKFSPDKLVGFLREYLTEMSNIIMDQKGFINKYEGDAIMALWGVFGTDINKTYRICETALLQQDLLKQLNFNWVMKGLPEVKIRIGIHVGNAIIGNIGAQGRKMEFTALGDSVNLASRLESVNKYYGTYLCVSEDIYEAEKERFEFRYLDNIRVKGKENSLNIYELINYKDKISDELNELFFKYRIAVNLYKDRHFEEALKQFTELSEMGDTPSITYKERCEYYIKYPPSDDWDGVWTMTNK
ncbi:MAG: adenylate/guanylate cyclase domain-containing protein [Candidatus Gracilibacteria bacterium]|nr:adenylate/guanylate cyclase domain-containing protein [Candidatus Gracilibacteria bacterium]